ncbi:acetyl-CoA carboxylase biotin carboxyl carrier protein [Lacrimispora saccharolytica]|uniref:Biotin carboxyl carrier protein of acetyl-CoA carboxylase n=1 Tax=Lacrimispora saccharolytica (strain ATCC 35040 / DSM 2544 / NRCC 2533 / WM1) TaxID=610130 RepID=D9R0N0_LACSW|nr:acetyl-CoA carboxylase biotin carboxyl carrier protein [Lacrimispora saccharolytica]ADL02679.1 acetyl-CoA carboxylase, biotin carboxyl carrier protein [[Clostridium] saccharolyticum WM1]QRV19104.1 acetyl-CoA carboxylase biotin carboxyl carrier protein [Lacrimispora saccharolytica]
MEINDIIRLMQAVKENDLTGFKMEEGDLKLSIKKEKEREIVTISANPVVPAEAPAGAYARQVSDAAAPSGNGEEMAGNDISSERIVSSPLVGTFYNAPTPDSEPFVKAGDQVNKGQVLGIIEAMKLMNEIECEFDGVVEAILAGNEDVVEYGQPLFRIR